ncbi:NB-ARC domain-containing protein [Kitasatospora sp. NPDC054768]
MVTRNSITGATVLGAAVQARTVYGGITLHTPPPPPVPRQLPRRRPLVDRHDLTTALADLLGHDDPRPVLITGPAGIGKTTLALHLLHQHGHPPGGQLYADLGAHSTTSPAHPDDVTARHLRALGITQPPADPEEARALLRTLTASRPVAVLLDDAADEDQVRALLPADGSPVIVTSRRPLAGLLADGAHHQVLGPLPPDAAHQLLAATAGAAGTTRDLAVLAASCRGVPLALTLTGARLATGHPVAPLAAPPTGTPLETIVTTALDQAYEGLAPDTAAVYRALGVLPLPSTRIDTAMAGAATGLDPSATNGHLTDLAVAGLIRTTDDGEYEFTAADGRRHAAELGRRTDNTEQIDTTRRRALDWLLAEAVHASHVLHPFRPTAETHLLHPPIHHADLTTKATALAWFGRCDTYLRTALETADHHRLDDVVTHLAYAWWPWLLRQRPYQLWEWTYDLAIPASERLSATPARPRASRLIQRDLRGTRATVRRALGEHPGAIEDAGVAYALALADGNERGQAQHLHDLAVALFDAGNHQTGLNLLEEALKLRAGLGIGRDTGVTRVALAVALHQRGETDRPLDQLRTAYQELTDADDGLNAGRARAWEGRIHARNGEFGPAEKAYAEAMNLMVAEGARPWQGRMLLWSGELAAAQGHLEQAAELLRFAQEMYAGSPSDLKAVDEAAKRIGVDL